jgi:uncharacterized protein (DUF1684 family)
MYAEVRASGEGEPAWFRWVSQRDELFRTHPQTPLDDPGSFNGLPYFDYDPSWRTVARFQPEEPAPWGEFERIGTLDFEVKGVEANLPVFWLDAYGGGLFLPFGDQTNGRSTYGGGRYLLDTVKGADLGHEGDNVTLDFNYAYHPSCVHSDRWACPLAPVDSRLDLEVTAGERLS